MSCSQAEEAGGEKDVEEDDLEDLLLYGEGKRAEKKKEGMDKDSIPWFALRTLPF